jgi:hypothetical protein
MSPRSLVVGVAVGAGIAIAGSAAFAAIPDSGGVVHACYQNVSGANKPVKLLNTSQKGTCPSGWVAVSWNQQGVQGPPGATGSPGVSGYATQTASTTFDPQHGNLVTGTAACPSGKVPIGGGFAVSAAAGTFPNDWGVPQSAPTFTRDGSGNLTGGSWEVTLSSVANASAGGTLTVSVVCASIGP